MGWLRMLFAAAAALTGAAAAAQVPPDPDAVLVEELVVVARDYGPAWWRVSDADTTVYVLGVPSTAPKHMAWDQSVFERRLAGANRVMLPPAGMKVKLAGAPGALISLVRLRSRGPFEAGLAPPQRARFASVRARLGQPPERYRTSNALAAGLLLITDYRHAAQLTDTDPTKLIRLLAQRAGVKVEQKSYDLGPLLGAVARTPASAGAACLEDALQEVERGPGATLAAARAWGAGDVPGALTTERSYERCLAAAPGALALDARVKADQAGAIARALAAPGHAIAVVQLRPLLSQGGVLDRLRARGFTVKTPGEE